MKIKKFKNIWTMGLIIFGVILIAFYILKLVNPSFIVGIAEIPAVVKFGTYVDTHKWANYLFSFCVSYVGWFFYCCACCRQKKLTVIQNITIISTILLSLLIQRFIPQIYAPFNYVMFVLIPFINIKLNNRISNETFTSLICVYSIDILAQALSMEIRNIVLLTTCINSATMTILLIDGLIWRILLYLFYNFKKGV